MELKVFDMSALLVVVAIITAVTNIVVQVLKQATWDKIPTNLLALIVAVALSLAAFFAYMQVMALPVTWYYVVAAVIVGFMAAYAAMFGFDKLKEILDGVGKKK